MIMSKTPKDPIAERLLTWLTVDSVTPGEADFLRLLENYFESLGYTCSTQRITEDRWNLLALKSRQPRLLYSTHVDTVPPFLEPRFEQGVLYGRGACDTKGGLLAMVEAAQRLGDECYGFVA
jgi:acetylornithine deacetylase